MSAFHIVLLSLIENQGAARSRYAPQIDRSVGSSFCRSRPRSGGLPRMMYSFFKVREESVMHPSVNKPRKRLFRTPENKKIRKLFSLLTPFGKIGTVLNERKQKKQKSPESRLLAATLPQHIRFSELSYIFSYRPPGPQFRENSRERAARSRGIESQRFDPPSLGGIDFSAARQNGKGDCIFRNARTQ